MKKNDELKALIFDIQSFSTHDGPGIRTNIFFKGCPLRCLWCANPEGQRAVPEILYTKSKCVGCGCCAQVCPHGAITKYSEPSDIEKYGFVHIDHVKCDQCKTYDCLHVCLQDALTVSGKWMTVEDVMKKIRREAFIYRDKGGITVSGGDPLVYYEFVAELLKKCHEEGINTALESELCVPSQNLEAIMPYVDNYLTDLKIVDEQKHFEATGTGNKQILKNLRLIGQSCPEKVCLRVAIIPGYTESDENIDAIGAFCVENNFPSVNILPYHNLGATKHERLGSEYLLHHIKTPNDQKMQHIADIIEGHGVKCIIN